MGKYRKKPVEVEAIQWVGGSTEYLSLFVGMNWTRADTRDIAWEHEDSEQIIIFNSLEKAWIPCPVGHWVIRGVKGEFYPCDPDAFEKTYEAV